MIPTQQTLVTPFVYLLQRFQDCHIHGSAARMQQWGLHERVQYRGRPGKHGGYARNKVVDLFADLAQSLGGLPLVLVIGHTRANAKHKLQGST